MSISTRTLLIAIACSFAISGCGSLYQKKVDIDPIAAEAGELIAKVESELQTEDVVLLIRYLTNNDFEEIQAWDVAWRDLIASLRSIGRYSVMLIDIAGARDEADSQHRLANTVNQLYTELRTKETVAPGLENVNLDQVLAAIENADRFYDASAATQAAIEPVVETLITKLSLMYGLSDEMRVEMLARIDAYHADVVRYQDTVSLARNREVGLLEVYDRAITNNDLEAWEQFRTADLELQAVLGKYRKPSAESIKIADDLMYDRLNRIHRVWQILEPDFLLYQQELAELKRVFKSIDSTLIVAQLMVESWDGGHDLFVKGKSSAFVTYSTALLKYSVKQTSGLIF